MKTRHNFNKDLRMDLACSRNDYFRPVFSYIHFKDGYAYACDTHILVKNMLSECSTFTDEEIEKLDGKFIGSKAYKSILSYDMVQVTDMGFECILYDNQKVIYPFSEVYKYPEMENVISEHLKESTEGITKLRIDPSFFSKIEKALFNFDDAYMQLSEGNKSLLVKSDDSDSIGIIMLKSI